MDFWNRLTWFASTFGHEINYLKKGSVGMDFNLVKDLSTDVDLLSLNIFNPNKSAMSYGFEVEVSFRVGQCSYSPFSDTQFFPFLNKLLEEREISVVLYQRDYKESEFGERKYGNELENKMLSTCKMSIAKHSSIYFTVMLPSKFFLSTLVGLKTSKTVSFHIELDYTDKYEECASEIYGGNLDGSQVVAQECSFDVSCVRIYFR
jgi:hypothetical protein